MAINKYDKLGRGIDLSWTTYVPQAPKLDVAGFDNLLQQQQTQYDQVGLLSGKRPDVLNNEEDLKLYQTYQKEVNDSLNNVTDAYTKGVTQGQLAYKQYLDKFKKDWSPGGRADILNKRYSQYQQATKNLEDFYKDDTSPVNKTLAKQQLQQQLSKPIIVDPTTGQYSSIGTPELYKNPNINKAVNDMLSEIKSNGTTQFLGDFNRDFWIQKIQNETREPERIKLAFQALASQPEYSSQINRDAQYKALTTDPDKYKQAFEERQKGSLKQIEDLSVKAESDKTAATELQKMLRTNGYNVAVDGNYGVLTKKAATDFLQTQKKTVQENLTNFNFENQLRNDVTNSYLGYALRGAYNKQEVQPIFNQAKKAQMDYSLKKEENSIALWRAQTEYDLKDQASTTAVSGLAQQLPEIQTYHKNIKSQLSETEKNVDKALSNSKTFKGWTKENVAEAYNTWNKVTGDSPEERKNNFKSLLAQKSDYPFTDQQIDEIFKEMNGAGDGVIKTTLKTLGQLQSEVNRVEEGQAQIASQYLNTPEGQANLSKLRQDSPQSLKNLSDLELVKLATSQPELFEVNKTEDSSIGAMSVVDFPNPAERYVQNQNHDIKKNKSGTKYDWGSLGTVEIYANTNDKVLKPTLDGISSAIETGSGLNFSSFGKAGLSYKKLNGDEIAPGVSRKVETISVTRNTQGLPVLKVGVSIDKEKGKKELAYTDIDVVPGSVEQVQLLAGMKKAYVQKLNQEGPVAAQAYLDAVEALEGKDRMDRAAIDIDLKRLNTNNTKDNPIYIQDPKRIDPLTGKPMLVDVSTLGWQSKNLEKDENINGYGYELWGFNTYTGNVVGNVFMDGNGNRILSPATGQSGTFTFGSSDAALKDRNAKSILSQTPVEVTETKVRQTTNKSTTVDKTTKE